MIKYVFIVVIINIEAEVAIAAPIMPYMGTRITFNIIFKVAEAMASLYDSFTCPVPWKKVPTEEYAEYVVYPINRIVNG